MPFIPYKDRHDISYETSSGIDFHKLKSDIESKASDIIARQTPNPDKSILLVDIVIIVEGHMLGAAAEMLCESCTKIVDGKIVNSLSTVCVLMQCSKEKCKQRRLGRRSRPKEEWEELNQYIDEYVWIGFEQYGVPALDSFRACVNNIQAQKIEIEKQDQKQQQYHSNASIVEVSSEEDDNLEQSLDVILKALNKGDDNI
eukprot:CAMPEP_0194119640 /NCGR_PEP_ID=MMETSP0150-20130528/40357_1 /TAXON_ID=122233 /ORGANISM="Chaetoceros debilis, Strain MM31A-1" /LENGTH=199 /DNA_ID=CAMNT_0038811417 /DNA_START=198 /DNA_END=797 /DNA_ORIENTATION=-